ncbi:flagellar export protein FliJ [Candidatus Poribacteria bacterium]|nr:MAG: flagellar export protein FliJ [Candidatus Poribacteria bacterium]
MRRFSFRLEPVLRYRRMIEEMRKMELAAARAEYDLARARLEEVVRRREELEGVLRRREAEGLSAAEAQLYLGYLAALRDLEAARREELKRAEEKLEMARNRLLSSRRDRRAVEILRERELERFKAEMRREELKLIDEVSNNKTARLKGEGR